MLAFAADVEGVVRVEALWRECLRRFGLGAGKADDGVVGVHHGRERLQHRPFRAGPRRAACWDSLVAALPSETLDAIEAALVRAPYDGDGPALFDLRMSDAAWRTAARAGLTVHVAGQALRVDASRNPYKDAREIVATEHLVDADEVLRARRFDAETARSKRSSTDRTKASYGAQGPTSMAPPVAMTANHRRARCR